MVNYIWENIFKKDGSGSQIISLLKSNILFEELSNSELKLLEAMLHIRTYQPGEVIFNQGERGVGMYIVLEGIAEVSVSNNTDVEGRSSEKLIITQLKKEDFFGEMALVEDNSRRTATAIALEDTQLLGFFQPDLLDIIERSPSTGTKISIQLAKVLARRLKETTSKVSELRKQITQLNSFQS